MLITVNGVHDVIYCKPCGAGVHKFSKIKARLPNGPGRLASFGAPNDGPVRGMHFGGLVRPGTESEYPGPDMDDCSFRIRS
jgi:hypothetical protein